MSGATHARPRDPLGDRVDHAYSAMRCAAETVAYAAKTDLDAGKLRGASAWLKQNIGEFERLKGEYQRVFDEWSAERKAEVEARKAEAAMAKAEYEAQKVEKTTVEAAAS